MSLFLAGILSSSLLILVILIIRILLGKRINYRFRYALWLFAAIKLLVFPVPYLSMENAPVDWTRTSNSTNYEAATGVIFGSEVNDYGEFKLEENSVFVEDSSIQIESDINKNYGLKHSRENINYKKIIIILYIIVTATIFITFVCRYFKFHHFLLENRVWLTEYKNLKVYIVRNLPSPCLFMGTIYMDTSEDRYYQHILDHEYTHYRHWDEIWGMISAIIIVLYWWNPLVVLAVKLSKQDAELACDESVTKEFDYENRIKYAETLVTLVDYNRNKTLFSTYMSDSGKRMKERIMAMKDVRRMGKVVACGAIALLGCCFLLSIGNKNSSKADTKLESAEDAHRYLISTFDSDEKGLIYPKEFCGDYVKDDILHIVLNTDDQDVIDEYAKRINYSDKVVFEKAEYGLTDLINAQDDICDYLTSMGITWYSIYVDQQETKIIIEVDNENIEEVSKMVEKYLESNDKYAASLYEAVNIIAGSEVEVTE